VLGRYTDYGEEQRSKILRVTIWVTIIASLVFAVFNFNLSSWQSFGVIIATTGVCLVALLARYKGHANLASILICVSVLFAVTYSIYDGDGLLDPGIVGYPLFVLLGTMLLDKRYTFWLTLAAILCLSFVGVMQSQGNLHLTIHTNDAWNLVPISIFLVAGALVVWVILDGMQKNYEQVRVSEIELRKSYELTIQGLSKALDKRDFGTGGHSRQVVELSEKLARAFSFSEEEMLYLRYGAYLHDIGKIGIPDAILNKPGPLTAEEWDVMHTHPLMAEDILEAIPFLRLALDIPKYHHEHWDGTGYPSHLKGTQIPLSARIFAVVDVWDALTNIRPYRAAWSKDQAREYIEEQAGKHFDPDVVKMFLDF